MSLLADLLSKSKLSEPGGGKDIPPTLAKTRDLPARTSAATKRYVAVAAGALLVMIAGIALIPRLERLKAKKRPATPSQQVEAPPIKHPLPEKPAPVEAEATLTTPEITPPAPAHRKTPSRRHKPARATGKTATRNKPATASTTAAPAKSLGESTAPVKIDTGMRGALLYAARSAEQSGDWRLALENYRKAQEIDPGNYLIMSNTAAALNNLGMYAEGGREARKALEKKPHYVPALINAAIASSSQGNDAEALRLFSAAHTADPGNRGLAINLGILQERLGKLDEALATYGKAAASGDHLALLGMGRVYERTGNKVAAINSYRRIMAMSDLTPAQKKEAKERLARLEE